MDKLELNELLTLAESAAQAASKEILEVYNSENFQTEVKSDNSPLTLADKKAHQAIVQIYRIMLGIKITSTKRVISLYRT